MITHNPDNLPWLPRLAAAWYEHHPNYFKDPELDYKPIRLIAIWLAERNGVMLREPVPEVLLQELIGTITRIAKFVAGNQKYRFFALDKINQFYRQEIMQQIVQPNTDQKKKMIL